MFSVATSSLPATNLDTHSLCVRTKIGPTWRLVRLYSFRNYDLALAAFFAIEDEERGNFAVRSLADPDVLVIGGDPERHLSFTKVAHAVAGARRTEENKTARWAINRALVTIENGGPTTGLFNMARTAMDSLRERGYETERWRMEQAVKDQLVIGRCHSHGNGRATYCFPKKSKATLSHVRCPECGGRLAQTSLAMGTGRLGGGTFTLIADPVGTYFDKSLNLLPGEKNADRERRLDAVHAAIEEMHG